MNLRPPRPKRGALPSCATSRKKNMKLSCGSAPTVLPLLKRFTEPFSSAESSCATSRKKNMKLSCDSASTVLPLLKRFTEPFSSAESICTTKTNQQSSWICFTLLILTSINTFVNIIILK